MNQRAQQLLSEFETQARLDIARLKAGELDAQECADLITNHCADYLARAGRLGWWSSLTVSWRLVLLRDKLVIAALEHGLKDLPNAAAILKALRAGRAISTRRNADGTFTHVIQ